jgi:hypothetical protein
VSDLVTAIENLSKFPEKVVRGTLIDLAQKVIIRSPVDTGRFRNNWNCSIDTPNSAITTSTDASGSKAKAQAVNTIKSLDMGSTFYMTNNLPYAKRLEFGWSAQAPNGMARITVAEFQSAINKAAAKL